MGVPPAHGRRAALGGEGRPRQPAGPEGSPAGVLLPVRGQGGGYEAGGGAGDAHSSAWLNDTPSLFPLLISPHGPEKIEVITETPRVVKGRSRRQQM
eukprot:scaffold504181_cov34-Prasinocladus_malaysianus.AAC.1